MPPKKTAPLSKPASKAAPARQPAKTTMAKKPPSKPVGSSKGTAAKKPGNIQAKGKPKGKDSASPKPKGPVWTKDDDHARTIQKYVRRYLAKKKLEKLKKEKQDFDDLMEKLQKEAWLKLVQMEREQAELERKKEEEERRKRKEEAKRQSRILEAAFDGDNDEILAVLEEAYEVDSKQTTLSENARQSLIVRHQKALVDCKDANNNTPLSEAAGGGHADTITMLIQRGVVINSRGRYHRTPLWRAAFGGHLQAVQTLLEFGGDPRLVADDGTNAIQVAAIEGVQKVLQDWDLTQTDVLLKKIESEDLKKADEEKKRQEAECNRLENEISDAEKEYKACEKELRKAHEELNKRIYEHDRCISEGMLDKKEITLQSIHDAEATLALVKKKSDKAQKKLSQAKLRLREQKSQDEKDKQAENDNFNGIKVMIKDLDDVLFRDIGGKIAADGRYISSEQFFLPFGLVQKHY
ncbi:putative IQ motif and ankyrin repeat domain-containing protein [Exaiptasia diaphana]|uniref:Uncharacterized protein n=1 Tax=Exaiptasia diaphana TaxID=2652724 RepID=A0A913YWU2_EXADI|nr:putative IQ motif and ankyrin repeat domain-containing protein [Exaiptasia diaphana]